LRHNNDGGEARAVLADRGADADLRLEQAIGATFASAVKEEDDGPFLVGSPIFRQENLIFVSGIVERDCAIEEAGIGLAGKRQGRGGHEHNCCEEKAPRMRNQERLRKKN
jgi:hypothetical protein